MAFIATVAEDEATGEVAETYEAMRQTMGYVPEYTKVFMTRPDVYEAWGTLVGAVAANMDNRRYELVTLAAAQRLRSSYCSLAHGKILAAKQLCASSSTANGPDWTRSTSPSWTSQRRSPTTRCR